MSSFPPVTVTMDNWSGIKCENVNKTFSGLPNQTDTRNLSLRRGTYLLLNYAKEMPESEANIRHISNLQIEMTKVWHNNKVHYYVNWPQKRNTEGDITLPIIIIHAIKKNCSFKKFHTICSGEKGNSASKRFEDIVEYAFIVPENKSKCSRPPLFNIFFL